MNRMVYKAVSKIAEQGYDLQEGEEVAPVQMARKWNGTDWALEDEAGCD